MLTELKRTPKAFAVLIELRRVDRRRKWFTIPLCQLSFGIPCIDLRRPTVHEQKNDSLGFRREMQSITGR
jgi:hypothetical protein